MSNLKDYLEVIIRDQCPKSIKTAVRAEVATPAFDIALSQRVTRYQLDFLELDQTQRKQFAMDWMNETIARMQSEQVAEKSGKDAGSRLKRVFVDFFNCDRLIYGEGCATSWTHLLKACLTGELGKQRTQEVMEYGLISTDKSRFALASYYPGNKATNLDAEDESKAPDPRFALSFWSQVGPELDKAVQGVFQQYAANLTVFYRNIEDWGPFLVSTEALESLKCNSDDPDKVFHLKVSNTKTLYELLCKKGAYELRYAPELIEKYEQKLTEGLTESGGMMRKLAPHQMVSLNKPAAFIYTAAGDLIKDLQGKPRKTSDETIKKNIFLSRIWDLIANGSDKRGSWHSVVNQLRYEPLVELQRHHSVITDLLPMLFKRLGHEQAESLKARLTQGQLNFPDSESHAAYFVHDCYNLVVFLCPTLLAGHKVMADMGTEEAQAPKLFERVQKALAFMEGGSVWDAQILEDSEVIEQQTRKFQPVARHYDALLALKLLCKDAKLNAGTARILGVKQNELEAIRVTSRKLLKEILAEFNSNEASTMKQQSPLTENASTNEEDWYEWGGVEDDLCSPLTFN